MIAWIIYLSSLTVCMILCIVTLIHWNEIVRNSSKEHLNFIKAGMRVLPFLSIFPVINTIVALIIINIALSDENSL